MVQVAPAGRAKAWTPFLVLADLAMPFPGRHTTDSSPRIHGSRSIGGLVRRVGSGATPTSRGDAAVHQWHGVPHAGPSDPAPVGTGSCGS
ncbi:hypothetical protein J2S66_004873 [Saccharothrix longispora]|uniref:Uncharacterized protein n=1 Tax=Saccharothrix longispora TaxID=33920 RepID=A0ABU1Q2Y9_9PSEU|nr:hypothetical protein [Saccharothrix longispora]